MYAHMLSRVGMILDVLFILHALGNVYAVPKILKERHDHAAVFQQSHLMLDKVPVGVAVFAHDREVLEYRQNAQVILLVNGLAAHELEHLAVGHMLLYQILVCVIRHIRPDQHPVGAMVVVMHQDLERIAHIGLCEKYLRQQPLFEIVGRDACLYRGAPEPVHAVVVAVVILHEIRQDRVVVPAL